MIADPRLAVRPVRWDGNTPHPDDVADFHRIYVAFETSRIGTADTSTADNAYYLGLANVDRGETSLVEADGMAVAAIYVKTDLAGRDVYADLAALPGDDEEQALALGIQHAVSAARRIVSPLAESGWTLRIRCWRTDPVMPTLLGAQGMSQVRRFLQMRIESMSPAIPARAPDLPPGAVLVVSDDEQTRRAIWSVDNESFLDHWNSVPTPYDEWWEQLGTGGSRDADGWWLLTVDGEPAAICLLDDRRAEMNEGYVCVLGVRRQFRRRGLAGLLLQRAFVRYRDMGRAATVLSVDGESLTGAVGVYERVGMHAQHEMLGWALDLS